MLVAKLISGRLLPALLIPAGFAIASCASSSANLQTGMTASQTVGAMGQPDLKDSVSDPQGSGAKVLRYTWLTAGKSATFGPDDRVARIADVETPAPSAAAVAGSAAAPPPAGFDPVQTPLNYLFYPVKLGITWGAAGVNCVAEGECRKPQVRPPGEG
jgi:hypothetical protein